MLCVVVQQKSHVYILYYGGGRVNVSIVECDWQLLQQLQKQAKSQVYDRADKIIVYNWSELYDYDDGQTVRNIHNGCWPS